MIAYALANGLQMLAVAFSVLSAIAGFMGYWYWRPLKSDWAIDENTTNRFTLPEKGHLSGLAWMIESTNEAALDNYDDPFPVQRTSLRVVGNGNVEIMDVRGRQLHAMNFWDKGVMPKEGLDCIDASAMQQFLNVHFGRYFGDPKYGLILDKFSAGIEFEETNDIDTTYYVDGSTLYSIWGLFRKDPEPEMFANGYLRKRQIINKDTASETQYGVKLPTVNKLRQIHMFSEPDQTSGVLATIIFTNLQKIWLAVKSKEEYILNNVDSDFWARIIHDHFKRQAHTQVRLYTVSGGAYYDTMIYEKRNSQMQHLQASAFMPVGDATTDLTRMQRVYTYGHDGLAGDSRYTLLDTYGICLHGDIPLLMTDPLSDEDDWLDAKELADVYVEFTEGASTGNIYIVLDELQKTYPS